jgi:hypothetical protein
VVVDVVELEPHPAWKNTSEKNPTSMSPMRSRRLWDFVPPIPRPKNAIPETGNQIA